MEPVHSLPECIPWKYRSELATKFFGAEGNERHRDIEGFVKLAFSILWLIHHPGPLAWCCSWRFWNSRFAFFNSSPK
jgi:hypothetical protein